MLALAMRFPGLPAPWLLRQDAAVIDTILDLISEQEE